MKLVQDGTDAIPDSMPAEDVKPLLLDEPAADYVLLEEVPLCNTTRGGLALAENRTKFEMRGRVLAVGPGAWGPNGERLPMWVTVGDIVGVNPNLWLEVDEHTKPIVPVPAGLNRQPQRAMVPERSLYGKCH